MNKKNILIIIIASILALLTCLFITNQTNKKTIPDNSTSQIEESLPEEASKDSIEEDLPALDKINEEEAKKDIEKIRKSIENSVKKETQVEKPVILQQTENKIEENTTETEKNENINEEIGILKEADSNVVVITKEFKVQSPAKYSFK